MAQQEPDRPPVRASDAERQKVADLLREHTSEGRLTIEEYEQRVDSALNARTVAELRPLLADLPVHVDEVLPAHAPVVPVRRPERSDGWVRYALIALAVVMVIGALAAASRGAVAAFPLLLLGIFVIGGRGGGRRHHH
ncbi:DUF1707 SHOCT-like domain-containing protein [Cryptosporangium phraense]|uniref:DUF1707 domain-containing protein n=1 Tax=Cryptosporangium phraense TaxID=2593070 RepID=A0A545AT58_9ACTN|nr:DUF1707 domain-containing protein [Cryptosporangium phraense]TQS44526.1 DUF1707 domain-containing protein [Cryptosporangium phraense]